MKPVYTIRPISRDFVWQWDDWEVEGKSQALTVHEHDETPIETGLLDPNGNKLFRIPAKRRIGFWKD